MSYVWVKLGRTWWPGQEVIDLPLDIADEVNERRNQNKFCKVVQFINEKADIIRKSSEIVEYKTGQKNEELIRKYAGKLSNVENSEKFRSDIIEIESSLTNRTKELTSVWYDKLFVTKNADKKLVSEIFKPPLKRKSSGVLIDTSRLKPKPSTSKILTEELKKKRYSCNQCEFSSDRVGSLTCHLKIHQKQQPIKIKSPRKLKKNFQKRKKIEAKSILEDWDDDELDIEEGAEGPPELRLFQTEFQHDEHHKLILQQQHNKNLPRTHKELSDAFEELLRNTKVPKVDLDFQGGVKGGKKEEVGVEGGGGKEEVGSVGGKVTETDKEVTEIEKVGVTEIEKVGVTEIDDEVTEIDPQVPTIDDERTTIDDEVPKIDLEVTDISTEVSTIEPEVPTIDTVVPDIESEVPEISPEVTAIDPEVPDIDTEVTAIDPESPEIAPESPEISPESPEISPEVTTIDPEVPEIDLEVTTIESPEIAPEVIKMELKKVDPEVVKLELPMKPTAAIRPTTSSSTTAPSECLKERLETDQIVHLVPVENVDGSVTYMLLSVAPQTNQQQTQQNPMKVSTVSEGAPSMLLTNSEEMEGIYIDKPTNAGNVFSSILKQSPEVVEGEEMIYVQGGDDNLTWETIQQMVNTMNENNVMTTE